MSEEDTPPGGRWAPEIAAKLHEADYGLICVTPDSVNAPWLHFEAGAISRFDEGRVSPFLLNLKPEDIARTPLGQFQATLAREADVLRLVRHLNKLSHSLQDPGAVSDAMVERRHKTAWPSLSEGLQELLGRRQKHLVGQGGYAYDDVVNAAFVPQAGASAVGEIIDAWEHQRLIPSRYLYISETGIDEWIKLCSDQTYEIRRRAMDFWNRQSAAIGAAVVEALPESSFNFVSLGPGDGRKDANLISGWRRLDVTYQPYDISMRMLAYAVARVRRVLRQERSRALRIKSVVADFDEIERALPVLELPAVPKVFSLLGNTLGNFASETDCLDSLKTLMGSEDLLLLEVRLRGPWDAVSGDYIGEKLYRFGPLAYLGMEFQNDLFRYEVNDVGLGDFPNTRTTLALYEHGYHDNRFPAAKLEYIHEYERAGFLEHLALTGWTTIAEFAEADDRYLTCLLRPNPPA